MFNTSQLMQSIEDPATRVKVATELMLDLYAFRAMITPDMCRETYDAVNKQLQELAEEVKNAEKETG